MGGDQGHHREARGFGVLTGESRARAAVTRTSSIAVLRWLLLVCLLWAACGQGRGWAAPDLLPKRLYDQDYDVVRAALIRLGYVPLRLQHDRYDFCWNDYGETRFCVKYPEALMCTERVCDLILARPDAKRRRGTQRYVVVEAGGEVALDTWSMRPANADDLKIVWARKDLSRRGCLPGMDIEKRDCTYPPAQEIPEGPPLPALPPLPSSSH